MAGGIKAVIAAQFDNKGIKDAQSEFGKLGKSMKTMLAGVGLGLGIAALTNGLKQSAKAAAEDAKSQGLLALAMKNTMGATTAQIAAAEKNIKSMEMMSSVADDKIRPAFATIAAVTGDVTKATSLTTLALDMAGAGYGDVESNAKALAKAYGGQTTALDKLVPGVKNAADKFGYLQDRFKGSAAAAANLDPFTRLQLVFGNLQESIGVYILPALNEFADWLNSPPGQAGLAKIAAVFGNIAKAVGSFVTWLLDNTWLVKTVAGVALWAKGMAVVFSVAKAIYGVIKATAIGEYITKAVTSAKSWQQALVIGAVAAGVGVAAFAATDALVGNVDATVETLTANVGKLKDFKYDGTVPGAPPATETPAQKAARLAAEKAAKARQAAIDAAKKAAAAAKQAFDDLKTSIDDFNKSFDTTASQFIAVYKTSAALGEFEQKAVDSFDAIKQSAQDAFDSKLITKDSLASLNAYANREKAILQGIAKDRDILAKKISIAQAITGNVMGSLNLTSMLESETKQVTKSVTTMVNGIALTTTQTFDEVVSDGLANSFKKLVEKTKTFAANLIKLKELGLNGNLFKQIVDAGAEGGNATAEAIIAGGAGAVTELNGLFKELADAGSSIAETATPVMYDLGDEMTNSFIDGLRSEDQKLIDTATAMAALFTESFKSALGSAMLPALNTSALAAGLGMDNTDYIRGVGRVTSSGTNPTGGAITINVNAGMIASKQEIPQMVVDALGTYTKQSGAGGLTRILGL